MNYLLIILMLFIAIGGLFKDQLPQKYQKSIAILIGVILVILAGVQIYNEANLWKTKWHGVLKSPWKSTAEFPIMVLGESQTELKIKLPQNIPVINMGGEKLYLKLVDGEAKLSLIIRDKDGKVFAIINDNEWSVAQSPNVLDRNFDKNKLEIINDKNEIVFQVKIEGEKAYIAGRFFSKEGSGSTTISPFLNADKTLFKYPSKKYPTKLNKGTL